jgi:hypothetical protein
MILPHDTDPSPVGELLAAWVGAKLAEVDDLVTEGEAKVASLPDLRDVWALFGELLIRVMAVEREVAELKAARRKAAKR